MLSSPTAQLQTLAELWRIKRRGCSGLRRTLIETSAHRTECDIKIIISIPQLKSLPQCPLERMGSQQLGFCQRGMTHFPESLSRRLRQLAKGGRLLPSLSPLTRRDTCLSQHSRSKDPLL